MRKDVCEGSRRRCRLIISRPCREKLPQRVASPLLLDSLHLICTNKIITHVPAVPPATELIYTVNLLPARVSRGQLKHEFITPRVPCGFADVTTRTCALH